MRNILYMKYSWFSDKIEHVRVDLMSTYIYELHVPFPIFWTGQGVSVNSEKMVLNSIVLSHKELAHSYKNQIIL